MSPLARVLRGLRQAGAKMLTDPQAAAKWRRVLEQRERDREQRDFDELVRRLDPDRDRW